MNILCYGDSNTHGYIPGVGGRYDENIRWTRLLQRKLGAGYYVIEEGLNGRTTIFADPVISYRKGIDFMEASVASHKPIDLVILMLGTNDIKVNFKTDAQKIKEGLECLIKKLREPDVYNGDILVISPIHIGENIMNSPFCESFGGLQGAAISKKLAPEFAELAKAYNCNFLDAADYAEADAADAIHLNAEGHSALAAALYDKIKGMECGK